MADTDKNIVIIPNTGDANNPNIVFSGANASVANQDIQLTVLPDGSGTLLFSASSGNLIKVQNSQTEALVATSANITGNLTASYIFGNGSQLSGVTASTANSLANGTSNVSIPASGGNVNTSVGGTSNVLVVTSTGANIAGTLNATGNANVGNIGATNGVFTNISGVLANGNSNVRIATANGNVVIAAVGNSTLTITGTGINVSGTLNTGTGNANVGNLGTSGNITAGYFFGNGSQLTDITATSATNAAAVQTNASTATSVFPTFVTSSTNANYALNTVSGISANLANNSITATTFVGSLSGTDFSNGTSNVSILTANGNITAYRGGALRVTVTASGITVVGTTTTQGLAVSQSTGITTAGNIQSTIAATTPFYILGNTPASANTAGEEVRIYGGNSTGTGIGGTVRLRGGSANTTGTGGFSIVGAGDGGTTGDAGTAQIFGGTANAGTGAEPAAGFFYGGYSNGVGGSTSLRSGNAAGIDTGGGDFEINAGAGRGAGQPGNIILQTATPVGTGTTLQTYSNRVVIDYTKVNVLFTTDSTSTTTGALVTSGGLGVTGNIYAGGIANITGNANVGNLGTSGNITAGYFFGNGSQLTGITAGSASEIANGTSNVTIPAVNGNVNISSAGNANILVVTGTGVNVAGTLNTGTGNANVGNIGATNGVFTNISGVLANGNSNVRIATANGNVTIAAVGNTTLTITGTGINVSGTLNTGAGNANVGNIGATTGVFTNISGTLTGSLANGTSNVSIPASGGNVNISSAGNANVVVVSGQGVTISANSTSDALRINQIGTGNTLVVEDETNPDSTPFVINNVGTVITGYTTSVTSAVSGLASKMQTNGLLGIQEALWSADALPPIHQFLKSRNATTGSHTIVANNDQLGAIYFAGSNGSSFLTGAQIAAAVEGTPSGNATDMPTRIFFTTLNQGASSPTERMRINSEGNVGIGITNPEAKLHVSTKAIIESTGNTPTLQFQQSTGTADNNIWNIGTFDSTGTLRIQALTDALAGGGNRIDITRDAQQVTGMIIQTGAANDALRITQLGSGNAIIVEDSTNPDATPFLVDANGNVGIANTAPTDKLSVTGNASVSGNVTAAFFIGNGSQLTGISASGGTSIINGTSNVVVAASGNVTVSVAGTANVLTVTSTGANINGTANITGNITGNYYIGTGVQFTNDNTIQDTAMITGKVLAISLGMAMP